jgi:hypothetical protein
MKILMVRSVIVDGEPTTTGQRVETSEQTALALIAMGAAVAVETAEVETAEQVLSTENADAVVKKNKGK